MTLYSFCARDKKTGRYVRGKINHELAFLDFFAMQFNNQKELMRFLGANPEKYDEISIGYMSHSELKILPIFFDSPELDEITRNMVSISGFEQFSSIYDAIAVLYNFPQGMQISKIVPEIDEDEKILSRLRIKGVAEKAVADDLLYEKFYELMKKKYYRNFNKEMNSSYLNIRKAYMTIRNQNYIGGFERMKPGTNITMEEYLNSHVRKTSSIYQILTQLELTPYEEELITRVLNNSDENAYEELMASSAERINYLSPVLEYLSRTRGKGRR